MRPIFVGKKCELCFTYPLNVQMDNEIKELKKQRDQAQFMLQSVGEYQVSRSLVWRLPF